MLMQVIQTKQTTTRNLAQFILSEAISIANTCCKGSTMTELHNNLFCHPLLPIITQRSFPLLISPLYRTMNGELQLMSISPSLLIMASSKSISPSSLPHTPPNPCQMPCTLLHILYHSHLHFNTYPKPSSSLSS